MTTVEGRSKASSDVSPHLDVIEYRFIRRRLTMRLSDAGLRQRQTKALYLNHRLPPWPTEDTAPRSLEPIVRGRINRGDSPAERRVPEYVPPPWRISQRHPRCLRSQHASIS